MIPLGLWPFCGEPCQTFQSNLQRQEMSFNLRKHSLKKMTNLYENKQKANGQIKTKLKSRKQLVFFFRLCLSVLVFLCATNYVLYIKLMPAMHSMNFSPLFLSLFNLCNEAYNKIFSLPLSSPFFLWQIGFFMVLRRTLAFRRSSFWIIAWSLIRE